MSATIIVGQTRATIDGYEWISQDSELAQRLNALLDPLGPSGDDPAPDYHAALEIAALLGGTVTEFELPEYVDGRIY